MAIRHLVNRLAGLIGWQVRPRQPSGGGLDPRVAGLLGRHRITLVLDVGANVGQYATALRGSGYRGRIVSFEPVTASHGALVKRAAADSDWTVADRMALGDAERTATIHVSNRSDMSSLLPIAEETLAALPKSFTVGEETVPQHRLDSVFDRYARADDRIFLKLDTQGSEFAALRGAESVLPRVHGVQAELSLIPNYAGETLYLEILQFLEGRGFRTHLILPGYYSGRHGRQFQLDAVLFREAAEGEAE